MARPYAFTLLELTVVLIVLVIAIGLLLPALGTSRRPRRQMQNNVQLRGIHQSLVMHAQGNNHHFAGLNPDGSVADLSVENRFQILLDGNYFTGDYLISPHETKAMWTTGRVTPDHYSYAMLQVPANGGRRAEWSETLNTEALVLSDRNVGTSNQPRSIHVDKVKPVQVPTRNRFGLRTTRTVHRIQYGAGWRGSVVYNDNHVIFESTHVLETRYGSSPLNKADDLFQSATDDDALLIHSGN